MSLPVMEATTAAIIGAIGQSVTAVTAVGGLVYAVVRGGRELSKWRVERAAVKKSEIAGEVLLTTLRLLTVLDDATFVVIPSTGGDDALRLEVARRGGVIDVAATDFRRVRDLAQTYLPDAIDVLLSRVIDQQRSITSAQQVWVGLQRVDAPGFADIHDAGFGAKVQKDLATLRAEARTTLAPIAQLAS